MWAITANLQTLSIEGQVSSKHTEFEVLKPPQATTSHGASKG